VQNIQGSLKINASYKDVEVTDVSSDVVVESRYASVALRKIQGMSISVQTRMKSAPMTFAAVLS